MRLTADLLLQAEGFLNAYKDRELSFRGAKIPLIENLAVLQDQFDVLDFSDNDIKKVDNFPIMKRLNCIILNNNKVSRIGSLRSGKEPALPNLETLILTNNRISNLAEINDLADAVKDNKKGLKVLSLLNNPVSLKTNYRLYCIHKIPSLKLLDYKKVTQSERDEAKKLFKSATGKNFIAAVLEEKERLHSAGRSGSASKIISAQDGKPILTNEQKLLVKKAIEAATTKEQIDFIEQKLKVGDLSFIDEVLAKEIDRAKAAKDTGSSGNVNSMEVNDGKDETVVSAASKNHYNESNEID